MKHRLLKNKDEYVRWQETADDYPRRSPSRWRQPKSYPVMVVWDRSMINGYGETALRYHFIEKKELKELK